MRDWRTIRSGPELEAFEREVNQRLPLQLHVPGGSVRLEYRGFHNYRGPVIGITAYNDVGGGGYMATFDMASLEALFDLIERFLDRPEPPIRIELVMPPAPRRRRKRTSDYAIGSAERLQEDEKNAIKRGMIGGK